MDDQYHTISKLNVPTNKKDNTDAQFLKDKKKIFVGGLPPTTTSQELLEAQWMHINLSKIYQKDTKGFVKKGFGFQYLSESLYTQYGSILENTKLVIGNQVAFMRPALSRRKAKQKLIHDKKRKLFVHNLPNEANDAQMFHYFSKFGEVDYAYTVPDNNSSFKTKNSLIGFVMFKNMNDANKALCQSEKHYQLGQQIYLKWNQLKFEIDTASSTPNKNRHDDKTSDLNFAVNGSDIFDKNGLYRVDEPNYFSIENYEAFHDIMPKSPIAAKKWIVDGDFQQKKEDLPQFGLTDQQPQDYSKIQFTSYFQTTSTSPENSHQQKDNSSYYVKNLELNELEYDPLDNKDYILKNVPQQIRNSSVKKILQSNPFSSNHQTSQDRKYLIFPNTSTYG